MQPAADDEDPIERLRQQTRSYHGNPAFRAKWSRLHPDGALSRSIQMQAFAELLWPVHKTLAGMQVLDVGCGDGSWLRYYLELGAEASKVHGVDVSDILFEEARAINPTISLSLIDGSRLPFSDQSFDLVTQWTCFMCIPTEEWRHRMAKEIVRVLRPGGRIFWWDTPKANTRLSDGRSIDPTLFFPGLQIVRRNVNIRGTPSVAIEKAFLRKTLGPLIDRLGARPTHLAALLGPK
jgi:ubiquinone/menaquinone biosynthesis C-methylase UbiE